MPAYKDENTKTWYIQTWYVDIKGKRHHAKKRGFATKRDAEKYEREFLSNCKLSDATNMSKLIAEFEKDIDVQEKIGNIKRSTAERKKKNIRLYIKPYFEGVSTKNVSVAFVKEWLSTILSLPSQKENSNRTRLSSSTLNDCLSILAQMFDFGIQNFNLEKNPARETPRLKYYSNDRRAKLWTLEQFNLFIDDVNHPVRKMLYHLLFYAGLRIGEALALTVSDVSNGKLSITKTLVQYENGEKAITPPKSVSSVRTVPMPPTISRMLNNYIKQLPFRNADTLLFETDSSTVRSELNKKARKLRLPLISPHILRHSFASYLFSLKKGDVAAISKILGHSSPQITLSIYSHMLPEKDTITVNELEAVAFKKQKTDA